MQAEIRDYLRHIRSRLASTTHDRKRLQLHVFLRWMDGENKQYPEVRRADVERFLLASDCTTQHRQSQCQVIREFFDFLKLRHPALCPAVNPAAAIEFLPQHGRRLPAVPSQATVQELFARQAAAEGCRAPARHTELALRDRLAAELAYGSGLRRCELIRLDIEDADLDQATITVLGKGDQPRRVPLTASSIATLRRYLASRHASRGPLLLSCFGRRLAPSSLSYVFTTRVGIRPHLLRHACATHLLANGCGVRVIQELLGHRRLTTTTVYTHITRRELAAVIDRAHPRKQHVSTEVDNRATTGLHSDNTGTPNA